jgi:hypothetical protein
LYRTLSVSLTQFINEENRQLNLFVDEYKRQRDENLAKTIPLILIYYVLFQIQYKKLLLKRCLYHISFVTYQSSLTQFINEENRQLNLFVDEYKRQRDENLAKTIDTLQKKYGKGIVSNSK